MADTQTAAVAADQGGMKKTLSLWNFFTIGFGAIIGTGWVLQVGDWMVVGGGPVPAMIAFLLGAIFLVPIGAVFGELTAAIPISGGIVEYVDRTFGRVPSYITGWFLALGNGILCPWEAIAISTLLSDMFGTIPGLEWLRAVELYEILGAKVYLFPTIISLAIAAYVIFLNFRGASSAAKLQAFLTKALLCGMLLAMGISIFTGSPANAIHEGQVFSQVTNAGGGVAVTGADNIFSGIMSVLLLTPFFYAGFDTIPQQAEEAAEGLNWNKFGKIITLALLASGGFYVVCIYSFGTILNWHDFVANPVPALACLKNINFIFYIIMLTIATLGPMGPMNSFYGATSRSMLAAITLVGPFMGKNMLIPLTKVSALAFIFSCTMVALACLKMRFTEPDLPRPYKVPGGKFGIMLAVAAGLIIIALIVLPITAESLDFTGWAIVIGWLVVGLVLMFVTQAVNKSKA